MVSSSGELLVGETIGIASEVGSRAGHGLVVEIVVTVHIPDDVIATVLHLAARVCGTVDVQILEEVVTAFVMQVVLTGIAQRQIFDMQIGGGTLDLQSACPVGRRAEIQDSCIRAAAGNTFVAGDDNALGSTAAQVLDSRIAQVILPAEEV